MDCRSPGDDITHNPVRGRTTGAPLCVLGLQVRQKIGLGQFKETSNARNESMFREATDFLAHLRTMERDLKQLEKQVEGEDVRGSQKQRQPRPW